MDAVKDLMARVTGSATVDRPAADAWRAYTRKLAGLADEQKPLCQKRDAHAILIDGINAMRVKLAEAVQTLKSVRADAANDDADAAAVKAAEQKVTALRAKLADLEPQAEVAALALDRITKKIEGVSQRVNEAQRQAPRLRQDMLLEEMAGRAAAFNSSLETFLDEYIELAAMAFAHDQLCNFAPGSTGVGSGHLFEIAIPLPRHSSYSQTVDHNLRAQIESRAAELLADIPRIR